MDQEAVRETPVLQLPRRRWWRDVILGIMLFACGFLVGGVVVTKVYISRATSIQRNGIDQQRTFARLQQTLNLNEAQAQQVQAIITKGLEDLRGIRRSVRPQVDATLQRVRTDVSSLLNGRQKRLWERRFDLTRDRWFPPVVPDGANSEQPPDK